MVDTITPIESPFGDVYQIGRHGNLEGQAGLELNWQINRSQAEIMAYGPVTTSLRQKIETATGLLLADIPRAGHIKSGCAAFQYGSDRIFVSDQKRDMIKRSTDVISSQEAAIIDQTHGKIALHLRGPEVTRTLSKLYAIDFDSSNFKIGQGVATTHHAIMTLMQRIGSERFQLYVPRSFARSFLEILLHAGAEYGVEIEETKSGL